ncbi:MAG: excisionase [Lachnospiraceae bacterium]|nr:excisionase [Lachnospiraceae bacterium]
MSGEVNVRISEKRNLTVKEATEYFGVDEAEIRNLVKEHSELGIWRESANILIRRIEMERHFNSLKKACEVKVSEKINLTIKESAEYFGIGANMIRNLAKEHKELALWIGSGKILIKRKKMEKFLDTATSI